VADASAPAAWKMVLVLWMAIFPPVVIVSELLSPILAPLPSVLRYFIVTGIVVPMVFLGILPPLRRRFDAWLHR
jgi:uncharacterized protein